MFVVRLNRTTGVPQGDFRWARAVSGKRLCRKTQQVFRQARSALTAFAVRASLLYGGLNMTSHSIRYTLGLDIGITFVMTYANYTTTRENGELQLAH